MKEMYTEKIYARLNQDVMIGELSSPGDVENYVDFEEGTKVQVLGHAYDNEFGKMFIVYSEEVNEATTLHENCLIFCTVEEQDEEA